MNKQINTLFQKEVTRKEFLGMLGLGIGSILGFSTIIRLLTGKSLGQHTASHGYGSSAYGGDKR